MATLPIQLNFAATDKSIEESAGAEFSPNRTFSIFDKTLEPASNTFDVGVASRNFNYNLGVGLEFYVQGTYLVQPELNTPSIRNFNSRIRSQVVSLSLLRIALATCVKPD